MYSIEQNDLQLVNSHAAIRYNLYFDRAPQHVARIIMEIDPSDSSLIVGLPVWTPGSYKLREFSSQLGNVVITDDNGAALPYRWIGKNQIHIENGNARVVRIAYTYYAHERSVRTSHINRFHAFIMPGSCLMYVKDRFDEVHHVTIYLEDTNWQHVSTQLSPVRPDTTDQTGMTLGALNYDILVDSPLEIGNHEVEKFELEGAMHEVAVVGESIVSTEWFVEQIRKIISTEARLFGGVPYDRYVFILQLYPGYRGGLEHARSSVNAGDSLGFTDKTKVVQFLSLLCHEYFHLWNVKRIRPIELGPFDYDKENYTSMLWLAEGITSYYDDLFTYRCGFYTRDEYLKCLSADHLSKLDRTQGRLAMSIKDSSYLAWVKLYLATPDYPNRFPSYYLKGGIIMLLLDIWIIAESNGAASLDDGMRALFAHYRSNPAKGITEEEFINIVESATGVQITSRLTAWLNNADELPYDEIFSRIGLLWTETDTTTPVVFGENVPMPPVPSPFFTGLKCSESDNRIVVTTVEDFSPGADAGIGIADEILFVNDVRIAKLSDWDREINRNDPGNTARIVASCDGLEYATEIKLQTNIVKALRVRDNVSDEEKALIDFWLRR